MRTPLLKLYFALSLRTHLLLLAFLLSLPAIGLIIHTGTIQHNDSLRKGFNEARRLVNEIATEQYDLAGDAEQLMIVLAQISEIKRHNAAAANALLGDIHKKSRHYGNVVIADRSGNVWASALPMTKSFSLKDRRTFRNAVKKHRFSSGEYVVGSISVKSTIGFGYPMVNAAGVVDGVIACNINFDIYNSLSNQPDIPKGATFSVIDRNGVIVYRNLHPEKFNGTMLGEAPLLRMKNGKDRDTFIDFDENGDKRIISYRKLQLKGEESPYLYIRAGVPLQGALEKARQAQLTSIAVLSLFLLAAVVLAIPIGNYCFVDRIKKLQEASRLLAEGNLTVRVSELVEGGELGELGRSFDEMAQQLADRETALRRSESELHDLNKDLAKRVEEETERRLKHERILARHARLAAIGEMIGAIAHQWRQPLATLGATIQSIRMAWEEQCIDDEFMENAESDARMQLEYMSDTIEDFRNFFSLEKVCERFKVREKIEEVVLLVSPQFSNSGVRLEVLDNSGDCPLEIRGYQNEFKQSVLNLVSNSFDSINDKKSGGNCFDGVEGFNGLVVIQLGVGPERVVIEVRDNGNGIPADYADKVFDPYFTSKAADKGTGIGLYMSRLIIEESMGGTLGFTSGPEGTVFRMEIPRELAEEADTNG
jgi:signal transduction histidine kinase